MRFDVDSLTLGEIEQIETMARQGIGTLSDDSKPRGRMLRAIITVVKRRTDPSYTFDDSANVTQAELAAIMADIEGGGDGPDPT
jgi:hypothetical protein